MQARKPLRQKISRSKAKKHFFRRKVTKLCKKSKKYENFSKKIKKTFA